VDITREQDIEQLRRIAVVQKTQIHHLLHVLSLQKQELDKFTGRTDGVQQVMTALECISAKTLDASQVPARATEEKKPKPPQPGHGPTAQPELEHVSEVFELDEPDRACPSCGERLQELQGQFETSEMIDVVNVRYRVVEIKRQKYVCSCGGCVETALGPERAIEGGRYSLPFAIKVAVDKYADHLPLSRQSRILDRHGLGVSTQTLWDQISAVSGLLRPTYDRLYEVLMKEPVIGLDQTAWPALEHKGKKWQMWCVTAPGAVYHRICNDKSADTFAEIVGKYQGTIVCDALSTHTAGARDGPGIELAGCWAHITRKFREAEVDFPQAAIPRDLIKVIYQIDARANDLAHKAQLRADESKKTLDRLEQWLKAQPMVPETSLTTAIAHTLRFWARLSRFVQDAKIPLDNNATERALRGPVVGRRNHFGSKSERGTQVAALFYSLIETAKLCSVNPSKYLLEATRAATRGEILLPGDFAQRAASDAQDIPSVA
jgi:transposase